MQRNEFKHFYQDHVRWGDCDQLGHLNNTIYLQLIESGRLDYFHKVLGIELTPQTPCGWIMLDLKCHFRSQVHYPTKLEVATKFSRVGNSSAVVDAAIFRVGEEEPVFTSSCGSVWCRYSEKASERVPDHIRAALKDFEKTIEGL